MSGRRCPRPAPKAGEAIWVLSDRAVDDGYVATVNLGPDVVIPLSRDAAVGYAMAVLAAVARAEYDAAVLRQFEAMPDAQAPPIRQRKRRADQEAKLAQGMMLGLLRQSRPALDHAATSPLDFSPLVAHRDRRPYVLVALDGRVFCQWSPADARGHATHVLDAALVADLDATYLRFHRDVVGVDPAVARTLVDDLLRWRDA